MIKRKKFDLVIMDFDMSSLYLNHFIQVGHKKNRHISIVLITASEERKKVEDFGNTSVDLIISKPIDVNKAVKQVLETLMQRG